MGELNLLCSAAKECKAIACRHKTFHDRDESCSKICARCVEAKCVPVEAAAEVPA